MPREEATEKTRRDALAIERLESLGYSLALPLPPIDPQDPFSTAGPSTIDPTTRSRVSLTGEAKRACFAERGGAAVEGSSKSKNHRETGWQRDVGGTDGAQTTTESPRQLPPSSARKETLSPTDLATIVESHRSRALEGKGKRGKGTKQSKTSVEIVSPTQPFGKGTVEASVPEKVVPTTPRKRQNSPASSDDSPPSPTTSSSSRLESPTQRYSSPTKRRSNVKRSLPLLSLSTASTIASSLLSTCESLVRFSPNLSLPDLLDLSRSLQENAQMLAIAQSQALSSGRTFGSSFDTLARLVASPDRQASRDPSSSTLLAAKALNLFTIPSEASLPLPISPAISPPLLILTTPRTTCLQCDSALTIRSRPTGPFSLVSPSEAARPVLVASHVCTNPACRARHSPDHVEITHQGHTVWIWESEARFTKVGDRVWVTREFINHFAALLLQQRVSPGGFAAVWNSLHSQSGSPDIDEETSVGHDEDGNEGGEDLEKESDTAKEGTFKLSPAHVWRSFVISISINAARERARPLHTVSRPSSETLVRFANRHLFPSRDNVHVFDAHSCSICTRQQVRRWRAGPASKAEKTDGVKWAGSLKSEITTGMLKEDTVLCSTKTVRFAVCDGIALGHFLCAYPSCPNPPSKSTRKHRFCEPHAKSHTVCGIVGCGMPVSPPTSDKAASEACTDPQHEDRWEAFSERRNATNARGWRGHRNGTRGDAARGRLVGEVGNEGVDSDGGESEGESGSAERPVATRQGPAHMWSLRRVAKLQLLVASCGTPIAWSKFIEGETPHAVLRFLTVVHAQLGPREEALNSSFPSYIAYDRACDVLREAVLAPTSTTSRNPFETPKRRRDNAPPPLPSFLESSRLVVTGFHQQCHTATDRVCSKFCNSIPLDGSAPDLVIPYVSSSSSRRRDRVFERAFNTSAAEQLNSSMRGYAHLLQGMKADNFDFLVNCILRDKKERLQATMKS